GQACFHPLRRNAPKAPGDVHFIPKSAKSFAASRACQDAKLQSPGLYAHLVSKSFHEGGQRLVIQGRVMFDGAHVGPARKQLVEMPTPTGWILAVPKLANASPIQNAFDSPSDP